MGNYREQQSLHVTKIGTDTLVHDGEVDMDYAADIADQVWTVRDAGTSTVLVSSGARALGGQERLTQVWRSAFAEHGLVVETIIFSETTINEDIQKVKLALVEGKIPLVNGDSTGETTENNDVLAARVAIELGASATFLTNEHGVLDHNRRVITNLSRHEEITSHGTSQNGTGGIVPKVQAARSVAERGHSVHIAHGRRPSVVVDSVAGRNGVGTRIA